MKFSILGDQESYPKKEEFFFCFKERYNSSVLHGNGFFGDS